jgi:hypothetical protein
MTHIFTQHSAKPRQSFGKAFFAECPTKYTRQRIQHSAKPRIPVVEIEIQKKITSLKNMVIWHDSIKSRV